MYKPKHPLPRNKPGKTRKVVLTATDNEGVVLDRLLFTLDENVTCLCICKGEFASEYREIGTMSLSKGESDAPAT